jgi:hypothetical protein
LARPKKYLMSVGVSFPAFGLYGHRYFRVREYHRVRTLKFLGIQIVWTSYLRNHY